MAHQDPSISTRARFDDVRGALDVPLQLHPGQRAQICDEPIALQFNAIVADSRTRAEPGAGSCTARFTLIPERGETSTFYLSLDREAPELAAVSAFGYRVTLRDVSPGAGRGRSASERRTATVVLAYAVESSH